MDNSRETGDGTRERRQAEVNNYFSSRSNSSVYWSDCENGCAAVWLMDGWKTSERQLESIIEKEVHV
jgi:hypothetical protein